MFTLEEYIFKRKKEDGINELDIANRTENTRICVNYVFEYFSNYLDTKAVDEKTVLHEQKVDKFRNNIKDYDTDIQEWLISLYISYGKYMNRYLGNLIDDPYFCLYTKEAEFRALSYEVYPKAAKKFHFLSNQSEKVYLFIKDHHRVKNLPYAHSVCDSIDEWIAETHQKHDVNLYSFCSDWIETFYNNPELWPVTHKKKSKFYEEYSREATPRSNKSLLWDYDYKQKNNLFNLDSLYRSMPKKSFVKGKKQHFEAVLLYCWLRQVEPDDEYWVTYLNIILPHL